MGVRTLEPVCEKMNLAGWLNFSEPQFSHLLKVCHNTLVLICPSSDQCLAFLSLQVHQCGHTFRPSWTSIPLCSFMPKTFVLAVLCLENATQILSVLDMLQLVFIHNGSCFLFLLAFLAFGLECFMNFLLKHALMREDCLLSFCCFL